MPHSLTMEHSQDGLHATRGPRVMNPITRQKFLRLLDGNSNLAVFAWYVNEHRQCERILDWCLVNRVIGRELSGFIKFHGNSILETIKEIVRRVEKEGNVRPLIVGRDIRR